MRLIKKDEGRKIHMRKMRMQPAIGEVLFKSNNKTHSYEKEKSTKSIFIVGNFLFSVIDWLIVKMC